MVRLVDCLRGRRVRGSTATGIQMARVRDSVVMYGGMHGHFTF